MNVHLTLINENQTPSRANQKPIVWLSESWRMCPHHLWFFIWVSGYAGAWAHARALWALSHPCSSSVVSCPRSWCSWNIPSRSVPPKIWVVKIQPTKTNRKSEQRLGNGGPQSMKLRGSHLEGRRSWVSKETPQVWYESRKRSLLFWNTAQESRC